ncbi:MAG TPA: transferrin receptor-like dimerization domain-containing protein [Longimicrobiales bacterium]|nr:transferrin receptor-like dimerization domain-containing protein [Longimicrobiales bacterium]
MNCRLRFAMLSAAAVIGLPATGMAQQPIRGFPAPVLAEQVENERLLHTVPSPDTVREQIRILSEEPHDAGSPGSRRVAEHILRRFQSYGLDATIEEFEALMPRPVVRSLELVSPTHYTARLAEERFDDDKDAGDEGQLPSYNAYSADGDVTAELVFVNYGLPEDYRLLDSLGISVEGRIVIAKYGRSWRGIKPKLAAERGAVGTIIYSDPQDDGYWVNDVYPEGPMRPEHGVQRGSVMDMPVRPGDPLTPGRGAVKGAERIAIEDAETILTIPVLPISYGDALPLLRALQGPVAPEHWRGALPLTYHIGPGPAKVRLALGFDWEIRPVYNVIGIIEGAVYPDEWIVHGNHHDAWVHGAADPISGQVALGETARALGQLARTGWRPDRTIVFAAWDAEEWGLIGSTEWVEKHLDELREKAVVYLNTDSNNRGWVGVGGSHSLQTFFTQVARDVHDPLRDATVLDAWLERRSLGSAGPRPDTLFAISALGSGSDYTAFLDHAGIAAGNVGFGGDAQSGVYHSGHDTFDHYRRFGDTTFVYGALLGSFMATSIVRLADAPVLPFEFTNAARTYRQYLDEIEQEAHDQESTRTLDLSNVRAAVDRLSNAAQRYEAVFARLDELPARASGEHSAQRAELNRTLYQAERRLTDTAGLPERPWFRHLVYAPGFYTGYGVKTMPGIREAVEDVPDAAVAQREAARVASALNGYAAEVERAATLLEALLR